MLRLGAGGWGSASFLAFLGSHVSLSCRPQSCRLIALGPGKVLPHWSLTFLANRPLVAYGSFISPEPGNSRHATSSLGPGFPWSPTETCKPPKKCECGWKL